MWQKIKMLILKIVFSPLWLIVALGYWFTKGLWTAFNLRNEDNDIDIWGYWRLCYCPTTD